VDQLTDKNIGTEPNKYVSAKQSLMAALHLFSCHRPAPLDHVTTANIRRFPWIAPTPNRARVPHCGHGLPTGRLAHPVYDECNREPEWRSSRTAPHRLATTHRKRDKRFTEVWLYKPEQELAEALGLGMATVVPHLQLMSADCYSIAVYRWAHTQCSREFPECRSTCSSFDEGGSCDHLGVRTLCP